MLICPNCGRGLVTGEQCICRRPPVSGTGTPGAQQTQSDCGGHDFCQRDELLARLTTAEQERDKLRARLRDIEAVEVPDYRPGAYDREVRARRAAEARVEALERERVVQATLALTRKMSRDIAYRKIAAVEAVLRRFDVPFPPDGWGENEWREARAIARAALACPPQQRGE